MEISLDVLLTTGKISHMYISRGYETYSTINRSTSTTLRQNPLMVIVKQYLRFCRKADDIQIP